jgi:hypothetical protein
MTGDATGPPIIRYSLKIYQMLLIAYPAKFNQEYGPEMLQVFQDCCLDAFDRSRSIGMLKLWPITLLDFVQSVLSEHMQKEIQMKKGEKEEITRLGGWALMLGGITFFLLFLGMYLENNGNASFDWQSSFWQSSFIEASYKIFLIITPVLLMVGMLGLRTRYGEEIGWFGKNILLLGAIAGPAIEILGYIIAAYEFVDWGWMLFMSGSTVPLVCIALFGVTALRSKPLPRWNVLPFLAGIWYPIPFFYSLLIATKTGIWLEWLNSIVTQVMVLIQFVTLFLLGYVLQGDVSEKTVLA